MNKLIGFVAAVLFCNLAIASSTNNVSYKCFIYSDPFSGPFTDRTLVFDSSEKDFSQTIDLMDEHMVMFKFTATKSPSGISMKVATLDNEGSTPSGYSIRGSKFPSEMNAMNWTPSGIQLRVNCDRK